MEINEGRRKNDNIKEDRRPKVIIHPKSITGLISLKTNDKKAQIVVKTAYRIGKKIFEDVFKITSYKVTSGN